MTQAELHFTLTAASDETNVERLRTLLLSHPAWLTAKQISDLLNFTSDREPRRFAEALDCIISGQRGYKHISHATQDEIDHFIRWMESQASKMILRAENVRRRANQNLPRPVDPTEQTYP